METGWYPEIDAEGTLLAVFRSLLGPDVPLEELESWPGRNVVLRSPERSVDVSLGSAERVFLLQFWLRGAHVASGRTADLAAAAQAARDWAAGATTAAMSAGWPFAEFGAWAQACERGEGIDFTWRQFHARRDEVPQLRPLSRFIELAVDEPRLRALFPFTSHAMLGFRRTPGRGPALGVWVAPARGGFEVRGPDRAAVPVPDAEAAVARVLALLDG
ncbi:DUF6193 family natural product biosynthesis protein [Amycolatopsis sp. NPDC004625]|uniref:DUF6193 family natural product biosynthesis protein n=1 Tax=Amycolatopsis sp. NPDC004625 TaxID=3154670 RepID=UPI0033B7C088